MSTRAAIARPSGDGFQGRYHHWDGYPDGLGQTLYELAQTNRNRAQLDLDPTPWDGDVEKMLEVLIDQHPAGWSTINGKDMRRTPGFSDDHMSGTCVCGKDEKAHFCQYNKPHEGPSPCNGGVPATDGFSNRHLGHLFEETAESKAEAADRALIPECYCHGGRDEGAWDVDEKNAAGSGVEYAYVFSPNRKMTVLSSYTEIDGQPAKMVGFFGMGDPNSEWKAIGYVDLDGPQPDWAAMTATEDEEVEV